MALWSASGLAYLLARGAHAQDLTPEIRSRLFSPTEEVQLARKAVSIRLDRMDDKGNWKCPYVRVYVGGKGPFTFLIDTGASYTLVSDRVVNAVHPTVVFDRKGHRDVVELTELKVGDVKLKNVWAIHDDAFGVDGILGFPAFGNANLLFDLSKRVLTVSTSQEILTGSFELPFQSLFNVPTIPVVIDGREIQLLIDTGDDAYGLELRKDELGDAEFIHPPIEAGVVMNGATAQPTLVSQLKGEVRFGPLRSQSPVVAINDSLPVGDFGYDVLRQFRFRIEPMRHVVVFQPLFAGDRLSIDGNRSPGFVMAFDGLGQIRRVQRGSPADIAGLREGDRIITIDGRPARSYNRRGWDRRVRAETLMTVRWDHAGIQHSNKIRIEELR